MIPNFFKKTNCLITKVAEIIIDKEVNRIQGEALKIAEKARGESFGLRAKGMGVSSTELLQSEIAKEFARKGTTVFLGGGGPGAPGPSNTMFTLPMMGGGL